MTIFENEPIRYPERSRWSSNNGMRRRWLEIGKRHADAVNAARDGDAAAAKAIVAGPGFRQPGTFSRSVVRLARKLREDVPAYRIVDRTVFIPHFSWDYDRNQQVARLDWYPMWSAKSA